MANFVAICGDDSFLRLWAPKSNSQAEAPDAAPSEMAGTGNASSHVEGTVAMAMDPDVNTNAQELPIPPATE